MSVRIGLEALLERVLDSSYRTYGHRNIRTPGGLRMSPAAFEPPPTDILFLRILLS